MRRGALGALIGRVHLLSSRGNVRNAINRVDKIKFVAGHSRGNNKHQKTTEVIHIIETEPIRFRVFSTFAVRVKRIKR